MDKKKPKGYVEIGVDAEDYYRIKDSKEVTRQAVSRWEAGETQYDGFLSQLKHWR